MLGNQSDSRYALIAYLCYNRAINWQLPTQMVRIHVQTFEVFNVAAKKRNSFPTGYGNRRQVVMLNMRIRRHSTVGFS